MAKIKFNKKDELLKQLFRLIQIKTFDSIPKKLSVIFKTVELLELTDESKKNIINYFFKNNNLFDTSSTVIASALKEVKAKSSKLLKVENFMFVIEEVSQEDMQYQSGSFLTFEELQYYIFRLTLKLVESGGYKKLSRNYFLSFKDSYKKFCGKTINSQKIAQLNKIVQKYNYIYILDNNRKFYLGSNHPLFDTNLIFESNKKIVIDNPQKTTTVKEQVNNIKQDYQNLKTAYDKQEEKLHIYKGFLVPCMN